MRLRRSTAAFAITALLLVGGVSTAAADGPSGAGAIHIMRISNPTAQAAAAGAIGLASTNPILYWGGPVVPAAKVVSIYWAGARIYNGGPTPGTTGIGTSDGSLIGYFLRNLAGSSYYNINTTYYDTVGGGHTVSNGVTYTGYWADNTNVPGTNKSVRDSAIQQEIVKGFTNGKIAYDPSTIYTVFSAKGVNLGGGAFTQYCAYHGYFSWNGNTVLYAVMPYDYTRPTACSALSGSPNGDAAADTEVNTLAHEIEEANTDPQLNAWYDNSGYENADKCAWTFGTTFTTSNGAKANMTLGTKSFLVQQNWVAAAVQACALAY